MLILSQALSDDNYIINQEYTHNIKYGNNTSDYNGCGWIACYNICNYLHNEFKVDYIIKYLEKYLWFNGSWGTTITGIYKFLKHLKLPFKQVIGKNNIIKFKPKYGIIFYMYDKGAHYTFFYKYDKFNYRFLNNGLSDPEIEILNTMLNRDVRFNACIGFLVK